MKARKYKQGPREHRTKMRLRSSAEGIFQELRGLCLSLPETMERSSFGHPNFVAGKKTFVTFEQFNGRPRSHSGGIATISSDFLGILCSFRRRMAGVNG
jgi:hypothetical protein